MKVFLYISSIIYSPCLHTNAYVYSHLNASTYYKYYSPIFKLKFSWYPFIAQWELQHVLSAEMVLYTCLRRMNTIESRTLCYYVWFYPSKWKQATCKGNASTYEHTGCISIRIMQIFIYFSRKMLIILMCPYLMICISWWFGNRAFWSPFWEQ